MRMRGRLRDGAAAPDPTASNRPDAPTPRDLGHDGKRGIAMSDELSTRHAAEMLNVAHECLLGLLTRASSPAEGRAQRG